MLRLHCPGAIGNPSIHMRLGQVEFELGNLERVAEELARAYLQQGQNVSASEDPKYRAGHALRSEAALPERGIAGGTVLGGRT